MSRTWVVSDTHYRGNDFYYAGRRREIIDTWNSVISKEDTVIHLGDVGSLNSLKFFSEMYGYKILVLGNHDGRKEQYLPYFDDVHEYYTMDNIRNIQLDMFIQEERVWFSHTPICPDVDKFKIHRVGIKPAYKGRAVAVDNCIDTTELHLNATILNIHGHFHMPGITTELAEVYDTKVPFKHFCVGPRPVLLEDILTTVNLKVV
jgi:calcineurin-like phosphoesterase family protein